MLGARPVRTSVVLPAPKTPLEESETKNAPELMHREVPCGLELGARETEILV